MTPRAYLPLADDLKLPLEAVTQKLAWLGTTGSGKTYGATKLAELFSEHRAQWLALDPVGVWYGVRLDADGKHPSSIAVPIFGGLHGDVPLEPTSGELVANLVVDQTLSAILDVSQFEHDTDKARFAAAFATRFFFRKKAAPTAVHLFLEECQEFVPQNPNRGEEQMLHAFTRMQKIGRNFGIGTSLISQRPQEINKKALNLAGTVFVFRTTGAHERKAIEQWMADKSIEGQDLAAELPKLETGAPHVWSPEWLKTSTVVQIAEKETFNASATPDVGKAAQSRQLAQIDLDQIRKDMAATIEKQKADDPRELRRQLTDLRKQFDNYVRDNSAPVVKERAVLKDKQIEKVHHLSAMLATRANNLVEPLQKIAEQITAASKEIADAVEKTVHPDGLHRGIREAVGTCAAGVPAEPRNVVPTTRRDAGVRRRVDADGITGISGVEQRILNALAELELLGQSQPAREIVAFLAHYTNLNSKGFVNAIGALRSRGLIDYPTAGTIALTTDGAKVAAYPDAPRTSEEVQARVVALLPGVSERILRPLIQAYPEPLHRETVAEQAGYSNLNSKGFVNAIGRLRSLGFIDYPQRGTIRANDVLFLDGARS